ncbi:MAG TPA: hypothetical protein VLF14_05325 [Candidatus Binatia bacterium]|nr:hypothetical protein [Candidatus Binatia bacterium]
MGRQGLPPEGVEELRLALRTRLRIALDCVSRALRATDVSDALDAVTLLHEEAEKALRVAERWKRAAG